MSQEKPAQDPLDFVRGMWSSMGISLPGMVTPTLDVDELDKRIADLKAVENWLKMNLNMLQMTTQGLEMQRAALAAMQAMSQHAREASAAEPKAAGTPPPTGDHNPFAAAAAMWPWNLMGNPPPATATTTPGQPAAGGTKPRAGAARSKPADDKK